MSAFDERCRLCLGDKGYYNIFEANSLIVDIQNCLGLKISLLDNLPQKICEVCLDIINKTTQLRKVAFQNDQHLLSLVNQVDEPQDQICNVESSQQCPGTMTYLKVRKDLFEPSVSEILPDAPEANSFHTVNEQISSCPNDNKVIEKESSDYKCMVCKKVFTKWKKLYLHSRLHNKTCICIEDGCGKRFATKGDLDKHVRTHTGEKPYVCEMCDKGFAQRGSLKSHKETVHAQYDGIV